MPERQNSKCPYSLIIQDGVKRIMAILANHYYLITLKHELGKHTDLIVPKRTCYLVSEITWSLLPYTVTEQAEFSYYTVRHWTCLSCNMKSKPFFLLVSFCNLSCEASLMFSGIGPDY